MVVISGYFDYSIPDTKYNPQKLFHRNTAEPHEQVVYAVFNCKAEINSFSFLPFERCQQWKMSFQMKNVSADWITIHYWCCFSCTQLSVCHNWDISPWICPWCGYTWADTANDEEQIVMIMLAQDKTAILVNVLFCHI